MQAHHFKTQLTSHLLNQGLFVKKWVLLSALTASLLFVNLSSMAATLHEVESGDNLTIIARQYGISIDDLVRANGMQRTATLIPNQLLTIPIETINRSAILPASQLNSRIGNNNNDAQYTGKVTSYVIQRGDNLTTLANRYGVSVALLANINRISTQAPIFSGQKLMVPVLDTVNKPNASTAAKASQKRVRDNRDVFYTVKRGDTLSEIANRHGMSVDELAQANDVPNDYLVKIKETLIIPAASAKTYKRPNSQNATRTHEVKAGEGLISIANKYQISLSELAALNGMDDYDYLQIGQVLKLPSNATLKDSSNGY